MTCCRRASWGVFIGVLAAGLLGGGCASEEEQIVQFAATAEREGFVSARTGQAQFAPAGRVQGFQIDRNVEGEAAFPLAVGRISALTVFAKIEFEHQQGIARVVLRAKDGREFLVLETYPALEEGLKAVVYDHCEETCAMDGVEAAELLVQAEGAKVELARVRLATSTPSDDGRERRRAQNHFKVGRINGRHLKWTAQENDFAELSYMERKSRFMNHPDKKRVFMPNTQGFELYQDGEFRIPPLPGQPIEGTDPGNPDDPTPPVCTDTNVFDWRNRHGENWMTPIRNQGGCGSCWVFAAVGAIEARINLHYNQHLDVNLSEQDALDQRGSEYVFWGGCNGGVPAWTMRDAQDHGLLLESCKPYPGSDPPPPGPVPPDCSQRWRISSFNHNYSANDSIKRAVESGPITMCIHSWGHCMVVAGYKTRTCVPGATGDYWLMKNSWGYGVSSRGYSFADGYAWVYVDRDDIEYADYLVFESVKGTLLSAWGPYSTPAAPPQIRCVDKDGDGYCNWGTTDVQPASCPAACRGKGKDPNDANAAIIGPFTCAHYGSPSCGLYTDGKGGTLSCGTCGQGTKCFDGLGDWWFPGQECVEGRCVTNPCN